MRSRVRAFLVLTLFGAVSGVKREYRQLQENDRRTTIKSLAYELPSCGDLLAAALLLLGF